MNTRLKAVAFLFFLSVLAGANAADFDDSARVISVAPQIEQVNQPQQECRTEYVPVEQQTQGYGGSIVGGVAGGLLGNQVGGGNGRTAATAIGAITGAIVGDRIQNNHATVTQQPVRQCHTVDHWEPRTTGYAVTYEYHGRTYTSVMPYQPGNRIRLHVSLSPRI
ncbi:MAG: glycine zipper protein [Herminiimonas sp.]|jgi:uncharacterized protein YcfJ|nr:glycine zipper protein [Herminiimonas sp.]